MIAIVVAIGPSVMSRNYFLVAGTMGFSLGEWEDCDTDSFTFTVLSVPPGRAGCSLPSAALLTPGGTAQ